MNSKSLVNCFVWNHNKFHHRFMYIAPSSDHSLLTPNLPFKVVLRDLRLFSDVWSENATLFTDRCKLIQIHQYHTMALNLIIQPTSWSSFGSNPDLLPKGNFKPTAMYVSSGNICFTLPYQLSINACLCCADYSIWLHNCPRHPAPSNLIVLNKIRAQVVLLLQACFLFARLIVLKSQMFNEI